MLTADYMVITAITLCYFINRQSLIFVCEFALCELSFQLIESGFWYSLLVANLYALAAIKARNINYNLQMALICYSVLYLFNAFDFLAFPHSTYFYVIFPYVIKIVDIYVICHLIHKGAEYNGRNTSSFGGSWFQRMADL